MPNLLDGGHSEDFVTWGADWLRVDTASGTVERIMHPQRSDFDLGLTGEVVMINLREGSYETWGRKIKLAKAAR